METIILPLLFFEEDTGHQVIQEILATTMIHHDGADVLLGLSGPGQLLITHLADNCHIQIVAHMDTQVSISNWHVKKFAMLLFPLNLGNII